MKCVRILPLLASMWASCGWAAAYEPCKTQANTVEINDCLRSEFEAVDRKLNGVYQALLRKLPSYEVYGAEPAKVRALLVGAQRQWVLYRKSDCDGIYELNAGGTIRTAAFFGCMKIRTEQRIKELEEWGQ